MTEEKKEKAVKARNFAFITYPESLPKNWHDRLEGIGVPMAISPLHDKDLVEEEKIDLMNMSQEDIELYKAGKLYKKPHYHVMYIAANPLTMENVRGKVKRALGKKTVSHMEIVDNIVGYYEYLTHESKTAIKQNKTIYDRKDLVHLNDFDIDRYITFDNAQKKEMFNAIASAIREHGLANIFDLIDYIEKHGDEIGVPSLRVMNDVISAKTGLLRMYFDGAYQRRKQQAEK